MDILKSFIVFEGLDGAGTTTQIGRLARYYEFNRRAYEATREPTSNPIGVLVRQVLQKKVVVDGEWELAAQDDRVRLTRDGGRTVLTASCVDGRPVEFTLKRL